VSRYLDWFLRDELIEQTPSSIRCASSCLLCRSVRHFSRRENHTPLRFRISVLSWEYFSKLVLYRANHKQSARRASQGRPYTSESTEMSSNMKTSASRFS